MENEEISRRNCASAGAFSATSVASNLHDDALAPIFTRPRTIEKISDNVYRCPICRFVYHNPDKDNAKKAANCLMRDEADLQKQLSQREYDEVNGLVQQDQ